MERQKLLWILFAVTVFLFIVISAGIIWFLPDEDKALLVGGVPAEKESTGQAAAGVEIPSRDFDAIEWVREAEEFPDLEEKPEESDEPQEFVIVYGEDSASAEAGKAPTQGGAAVKTDSASVAAVEKPASRAAAVPVQTAAPQAAPKSDVPREPSKRTVRVTEFWIQAGSFSNQSRAENARQLLQEKGFSFRIITKEIGGEITYRLRMGPYEEMAEAEKFLSWVKRVDQFADSYISRVYVQRTVN